VVGRGRFGFGTNEHTCGGGSATSIDQHAKHRSKLLHPSTHRNRPASSSPSFWHPSHTHELGSAVTGRTIAAFTNNGKS
jgi:hypothetical protein